MGGKKCEYAVNASGTTLFLIVTSSAGVGTLPLVLATNDGSVSASLTVKNSGPDPILATTKVVNDWEEHGGHNGSWDNGWSGGTTIVTEDGNNYLKITGSVDGWLINCNHQSNGAPSLSIANIENYVLKLDVKIDASVTGAELAQLQLVS